MHTAALTFGLRRNSPPPLEQLRSTIRMFMSVPERSNHDQLCVLLIVEEWLTNLLTHGCVEGRDHVASMTLSNMEPIIRIRLEDDCSPFDPTAQPAPALDSSLDHRKVGGLGVHLIRSMVEEMRYVRTDGRNLWELDRRIDTP